MASSASPRHKRDPGGVALERRRELIEAAIRDIASNGYAAVTFATICAEAGFSRGLIGHYFVNKDELLLEAVKSVAVELGQSIRNAADAAKPDPAKMLHALIHASFTPPGLTEEKVAVWVALASSAQWSAPLAKIYREIWVDYRAGISRLFSRAASTQGIKINAANVALAFSQLVEGLWIGLAADRMDVSVSQAELCCHHYVNLVLKEALTAKPASSKSTRNRHILAA